MKRMLINATQAEERRLAIVDGQKLLDFETEIEGREQRKGNIYKAIVTRVEPSLEACFVDYGEDRHGFLPFKEVARAYFPAGVAVTQARIQDVLKEGHELVIQVEKEERGNKGAALTTFVSLAGRYVVLMPNNPRGGGVSRRIEGEERQELKAVLDQLDYPKGMSVIARTAGIGRSAQDLQWDLNYLLKLWSAIESASKTAGAFLIYQESSLVIRAIRDHYNSDIGEILIDTNDIYEQAHGFMSHVMPDQVQRVKRYRDEAPLFSRFQIEHQIESAYARTVHLPSGGAIVIDHTEALVSIDVNSARAIKGGDIEETATRTNIEAAEEVARQARLRDLGGLIVIDFIDMDEAKNRREVENRLRDALRTDRARVQLGSISKFGLLEMSRQRLRPALNESASIPCPRCGGSGHIRDTESSALQILRVIQEESMKESTAAVLVQVPVEVASFLLNEKRTEITKIELQQRIHILMVPNKTLETPNYKLERLKHDDARLDNLQASYTLAEEGEDPTTVTRRAQSPSNKQTPVIKGVVPDAPAPAPSEAPAAAVAQPTPTPVTTNANGGGLLAWIKRWFTGSATAPGASEATPAQRTTVAQPGGPRHAAAHAAVATKRSSRKPGDDSQGSSSSRDATQGETRQGRRGRNARPDNRRAAKPQTAGGSAQPSVAERETTTPTSDADKPRRERRDRSPRRPAAAESVVSDALSSPNSGEAEAPPTVVVSASADRDSSGYSYFNRATGATEAPSDAQPVAQDPTTLASDDDATSRARRPRRSRDRYGRDRQRDVAPSSATADGVTDDTSAATPSVDAADTPTGGPAIDTLAAPPSAVQIPALPQVQAFALPVDELMSVSSGAGMQWVQSDAQRVAQVQALIAAEPRPVHVPRQRPVPVVMDELPLILVETRRDLAAAESPAPQAMQAAA